MNKDTKNMNYLEFKGTNKLLKMTANVYSDVGGYYIELTDMIDDYCEWKFIVVDENYYQIINPATGFALDNDGKNLYGHTANNGPYQQWKLTETDGAYVLQNQKTNVVLVVQEGGPTVAKGIVAVQFRLWNVLPLQEINAYVYVSNGEKYKFPEQALEEFNKRPNTGVCFSGGGNRALTAAMGQLRGLTKLNLIDNIRYISCASGGSWTSAAYTYYRKGAQNDEEFLGSITEPKDITMMYLSENIDENCIGYSATRQGLLLALLAKSLIDSFKTDETLIPTWNNMIGEYYFKHFGLFDSDNPAYFSLNSKTVADIKKRNPCFSDDIQFYTTRKNRPYLIINSTMITPSDLKITDDKKSKLTGFEYTPLYIGNPFGQTIEYEYPFGGKPQTLFVGGGFVEPFAFGGLQPTKGPDGAGLVSLQKPRNPFKLADAAGTSSMAFAELIKEVRSYGGIITHILQFFLDNILHTNLGKWMNQWFNEKSISLNQLYWPVDQSMKHPATMFTFGDGGLVDNNGLFSLLVRKVKTIIIFVNTETELNLNYDSTKAPEKDDIDASISSLFGWPYNEMFQNLSRNTVFDKKDFSRVINGLQKAKKAGETVMATTELTVIGNEWWGIEKDWNVKICWVYNERVKNWENLLPNEVKEEIENNTGTIKDFPLFPCSTHFELSVVDVKLLADLSCWNITQNEKIFRDLLTNPSDKC